MSVTSDFYLARAADSARDAEATQLANVKERCLRSEAAWRAMADRSIRSEAERKRQVMEKSVQVEPGE